MKTKIEVRTIEEKTSKLGKKYHTIGTDKGNMSCFEADMVKKLAAALNNGKTAVVNAEKSGAFTNIRAVFDEEELIEQAGEAFQEKQVQAYGSKNISDTQMSIFVSYGKDLAVAGVIEPRKIRYWVKEFINIYNEER